MSPEISKNTSLFQKMANWVSKRREPGQAVTDDTPVADRTVKLGEKGDKRDKANPRNLLNSKLIDALMKKRSANKIEKLLNDGASPGAIFHDTHSRYDGAKHGLWSVDELAPRNLSALAIAVVHHPEMVGVLLKHGDPLRQITHMDSNRWSVMTHAVNQVNRATALHEDPTPHVNAVETLKAHWKEKTKFPFTTYEWEKMNLARMSVDHHIEYETRGMSVDEIEIYYGTRAGDLWDEVMNAYHETPGCKAMVEADAKWDLYQCSDGGSAEDGAMEQLARYEAKFEADKLVNTVSTDASASPPAPIVSPFADLRELRDRTRPLDAPAIPRPSRARKR